MNLLKYIINKYTQKWVFRYISKCCGNGNRKKLYETESILMLIMLIYDGILYYFLKMEPPFFIREQTANLLSFVLG